MLFFAQNSLEDQRGIMLVGQLCILGGAIKVNPKMYTLNSDAWSEWRWTEHADPKVNRCRSCGFEDHGQCLVCHGSKKQIFCKDGIVQYLPNGDIDWRVCKACDGTGKGDII